MTIPYVIGIGIAGFRGSERTAADSLLRLAQLDETAFIAGVITHYVRALNFIPKITSGELDVYEGGPNQSTLEFVVTGITSMRGALGIATLNTFLEDTIPVQLYRFLKGGRARPWFTLTSAINDGFVALPVNPLNTRERDPGAGDIVYIGREAMLVSTYTPGQINISPGRRGAFETEAEPHRKGAEVYVTPSNNPLRVDREVDCFFYEPGSTSPEEIKFWRGFIEDAKIINGMQSLSTACIDIFGQLGERRLGAGRMQGEAYVRAYTDRTTVKFIDDSPTDDPPVLIYVDSPTGLFPHMMFEIDGQPRFLQVNFSHGFTIGTTGEVSTRPDGLYQRPAFRDSTVYPIGVVESVESGEGKRLECHEILSSYNAGASYFKDRDGIFSNHPVDIMLCLLTSTGTARWGVASGHVVGSNGDWDWLPGRWSLGINIEDIGTATFTAVKLALPGFEAPFLWLGQGGDEPDGAEVLYQLAQAMGCYLYRNGFGQICLRRFFDPGPRGIDFAFNVETDDHFSREDFSDETRNERPIRQIKLEVGGREPGGDPRQIVRIEDLTQTTLPVQRYLTDEEVLESTRVFGDRVTGRLTQALKIMLLMGFAYRWEARQGQLPRYTLRLAGDATAPITSNGLVTPGLWVSITDPAIPDRDGTRGINNHRCLVIDADFDGENYQQRITVEDHSYVTGATSVVSPCWRVSSVTSKTVFHVDETFASAALLKHRAEYTLFDKNGAVRDVTAREGSVSGSTITLSAGWSVDPDVGDIVQIALYDDAGDWQVSGGNDVDHTWLADSNNELGAAGDDAQRWGV